MDYNIKLSNGQVLKGIIESPGENIRAVIVLIHGIGDHIQRFNHWAELFNREGIAFTGMDLPGHGRSQGRRGDIKSYKLLGEIIDILLNGSKKTFPGVPIFLYGHSLGGGIVLDYLIRNRPEIKGAIVTSPWLRLPFEPSRIKLILASVMKRLIPGLTQSTGLVIEHISHDENVLEKYRNDPLVHGKISLRVFNGAMNAAKFSLAHASELSIKTLMMHGSDDLLTSPEASMEFARNNNMVDLKIWDGGYHELHNEPFKDEVFTYILNWINKMVV